MAIPLTIPFSKRLPGQTRPPGIGLESQTKDFGARQIGGKIDRMGDFVVEWQQRRDDLALANARADLEIWSNKAIGDIQNTPDADLSAVDPETKDSGFIKAGKKFQKDYKQQVFALGRKMGTQEQREFLKDSQVAFSRWGGRLTSGLLAREKEVRQNEVRQRISALAVSDPEELNRYAPIAIRKWFPPQEWGRMADYAKEREHLHLIEMDPHFALENLNAGGPEAFSDPGLYTALVVRAKNAMDAGREALDLKRREIQRQTEQSLTAEVFKAETNPDPENAISLVGVITDAVQNDLLDAVAGRVLTERLKQRPDPSPQEQAVAFGALSRATIQLEDGKIDRRTWDRIFRAHANELPAAKLESFLSRAEDAFAGRTTEKADRFSRTRKDAEKLASDALGVLYPTGVYEPVPKEGGTPNQLLLDAAVGGAMEQVERLLATKPANQPVDDVAMRQQVNSVVAQVYKDEYAKARPTKTPWWKRKAEVEPTLPEPKTQAEYDALPPGSRYKHPDGTIKVKQ